MNHQDETDDLELYDEPESLTEVIVSLTPTIKDFVKTSAENAKAQLEVSKMVSQQDFSLKAKQMDVDMSKFKWVYVLVSLVMLALIGIAAGVIFVLRDVEKGVLIISHLVTLVVGLLGGVGLKKVLEKDKKD